MTKIIYILILILFTSSCSETQCSLTDGKYKVQFDKEFVTFHYKVKSDTIEEIYDDQRFTSIIEWISDNEYFLSDLVSHITYKDDLNKQIYTYGKPFYRLVKCNNDTVYFKLMRNQNDAVNTGKMMKID